MRGSVGVSTTWPIATKQLYTWSVCFEPALNYIALIPCVLHPCTLSSFHFTEVYVSFIFVSLTSTRLTYTPSIILCLVQVQYSSFHFTEVIILHLVQGQLEQAGVEKVEETLCSYQVWNFCWGLSCPPLLRNQNFEPLTEMPTSCATSTCTWRSSNA